jgi:hypothetical protein
MWKRLSALLVGLALSAGCSGGNKEEGPPKPTKPERLPPEVEHGPEEAIRQSQQFPRAPR